MLGGLDYWGLVQSSVSLLANERHLFAQNCLVAVSVDKLDRLLLHQFLDHLFHGGVLERIDDLLRLVVARTNDLVEELLVN